MYDIRTRCFVFLFSPLSLSCALRSTNTSPSTNMYRSVCQSLRFSHHLVLVHSSLWLDDAVLQVFYAAFLVLPIDTARVCHYGNLPWSWVKLYEHELRYRYFKNRVKHTIIVFFIWNKIWYHPLKLFMSLVLHEYFDKIEVYDRFLF